MLSGPEIAYTRAVDTKYRYIRAKYAVFVSTREIRKYTMEMQSMRMRVHMAFCDHKTASLLCKKQMINGCSGSDCQEPGFRSIASGVVRIHVCVHAFS